MLRKRGRKLLRMTPVQYNASQFLRCLVRLLQSAGEMDVSLSRASNSTNIMGNSVLKTARGLCIGFGLSLSSSTPMQGQSIAYNSWI